MKNEQRRHKLKQFHHLLNTTEGKLLMDELKSAWRSFNPLDPNVQTMGFNVGLGEAYRQMESWQEGVQLDTDDKLSELEEMQIA